MKTALDNVINASLKTRVIEKPAGVNLKTMIQSGSKIYDKTRTMPSNLKKLSEALMTIPPTSIESERAFSTSSNFCTKKRSSLSDFSLNTLVFLKYYFLSEDK